MTVYTHDLGEDDPGPALRIARWRLQGGHAAARQVRRRVHGALRGWGLGPVAGDLTDHLTTLVQEGRRDLRRAGGRLRLDGRVAASSPSGASARRRADVRWPWGSRSTTSTRRPSWASAAAAFAVVAVLPTPPFWFTHAMVYIRPSLDLSHPSHRCDRCAAYEPCVMRV